MGRQIMVSCGSTTQLRSMAQRLERRAKTWRLQVRVLLDLQYSHPIAGSEYQISGSLCGITI
jgi:hypothetical protein